MKKIMSKILIIFIIMIILFEFIYPSNVSYAALDISDEFINAVTNLMGGIVAYGINLHKIIALGVSTVFNGFLSISYAASCGVNWGLSVNIATPYSIFFNKYVLFDVNFFDLDLTTENSTMIQLRNGVAEWYYLMRIVASVILLVILIYIGIRMAISTVADEKAKYKKMFFDWCCSLALVFVLHYIAVFTIYVNEALVETLREIHKGSDMDWAILLIALEAIMPIGIGSVVATFVYCMLVFQTISFMISYTQRMLKAGFLIIISPLISITYSIDKIGDGKAQALNSWLKEFVYTILIQPFHCLIYMAFVSTAIVLLKESTILATIVHFFTGLSGEFNTLTNGVLMILCLKFINDGEKAIRKIFNFQDDSNLTSLAAGTMVTIAAVKNAQKLGEMGAKGASNVSEMYGKLAKNAGGDISKSFSQAFSKGGSGTRNIGGDIGKKLANSKIGQGVSKFAGTPAGKGISKAGKNTGKWVGKKAKNAGSKMKSAYSSYQKWSDRKHSQWDKDAKDPNQSRLIRGAKSWLRKQIPTTHNLKRALPGALGLMGAAMSYATGDSGTMEALGVGSAMSKGSEKFFANTFSTIAKEKRKTGDTWEESKLDLEKNQRDTDITEAAKAAAQAKGQEMSSDYARSEVDKLVKQYIRDQRSLDIEKAQKGGVSPERLKEIEERRKKWEEDGVLDAIAKRADLESEKGVSEFKQKLREDLKTSGASYSSDEIKNKASAILALLQEYKEKKKKQPENDTGNTNSSTENKQTSGDDFNVGETMDLLRNSINRSVVFGSGGTFDASEMLQKELKLNDDGSDTYQNLVRATLEYREMLANNSSEAVFDKWEKLQGDRESLQNRAYRGTTST